MRTLLWLTHFGHLVPLIDKNLKDSFLGQEKVEKSQASSSSLDCGTQLPTLTLTNAVLFISGSNSFGADWPK